MQMHVHNGRRSSLRLQYDKMWEKVQEVQNTLEIMYTAWEKSWLAVMNKGEQDI